ncbi:SGNH/GDSL hydrolase family protein [Ornithinibacillus sp. 4-3]|uniref:SGNH/GDSL hydrolase family protein n=1 Tax=Ornithinibacillus sp. 4-3 TaxID=3231488 RepID=A0AB39HP70_9BACI
MKIGLIGDSLTEGRPGVSFVNILKDKYPSFTLENLGKPGESVKSLHTRLTKTPLDTDYDLSFLWIGVNDVYSKLLKVQAQPIVSGHEEFQEYFTNVLELVITSSKRVVAVSPAIVGEKIENTSNKELKELALIIQFITNKYPDVSFLNMHSVFEKGLAKLDCSDYISTSVMGVMKDVLFYRNPVRIDKLSKKRGLHLTLDGIHLNSKGASLVADEYAALIDQFLHNKDATVIK